MRIDQKEINAIAQVLKDYFEYEEVAELHQAGILNRLSMAGPLGQAIRAQFNMTDQEVQNRIGDAVRG